MTPQISQEATQQESQEPRPDDNQGTTLEPNQDATQTESQKAGQAESQETNQGINPAPPGGQLDETSTTSTTTEAVIPSNTTATIAEAANSSSTTATSSALTKQPPTPLATMPPPSSAAELFAKVGLNRTDLLSSCILKHPDLLASVEKSVLDFLTSFLELDQKPDTFNEAAFHNLELRVADLLAVGLKALEPFQAEVLRAHQTYKDTLSARQRRQQDQLEYAAMSSALEATQKQMAEVMQRINEMMARMEPLRARLEAPPPPTFSSNLIIRNLGAPPSSQQ